MYGLYLWNRFSELTLLCLQEDIQTISWPEVVRRITIIREENPVTALSSAGTTTTAKLDAHDIANRIMRQENYLIALFNKELLNLQVPLPRVLRQFSTHEDGKGRILTRALEWNLRFCLMEYLFDPRGKVRKVFLKSKNRNALIEGFVLSLYLHQVDADLLRSLRRRLVFMGILNAIFMPFIVLYLVMYSFFRYFEVCDCIQCFLNVISHISCRNTIRIRLLSEVDDTLLLQDGNSENSTSFRTSLRED
jgi:autophagy-related protein 9